MRATQNLEAALRGIVGEMGWAWPEKTVIEPPKDHKFGDLAVNIAMTLSKEAGKAPRALAELIAEKLRGADKDIVSVEIAGPGFLNIRYSNAFWQDTVRLVEERGSAFGASDSGKGRKVLLEYVSANPTGPLHIGHGRGAAIGDTLARLMRCAGYDVHTEYYINDAGRQMRLLGLSVWLRVLELAGKPVDWPEDWYRGSYIIDLAREVLEKFPDIFSKNEDESVDVCFEYAMNSILDGIKQDLADFRVEHQEWFSEKSLVNSGAVDAAFARLEKSGYSFEKDGALWFRTTELGDDKDRVLRKSDGTLTYFASDIAYHNDKYERGFDLLVDVWGADHHGYIPRMRAAVNALGREASSFDVVLVQLVNLLKAGELVAMSTRAGQFETLADVVKEVGADAARFMFMSRKSDSPLDFDLDLVKQRSMDNPVYYVQYAHARIRAIWRKAGEQGVTLPEKSRPEDLALLNEGQELQLMRLMDNLTDVVAASAAGLAPHHLSYYLTELAGVLHSYYSAVQVLNAPDQRLVAARLALLRAVGLVLKNGLNLLGVSAPEAM